MQPKTERECLTCLGECEIECPACGGEGCDECGGVGRVTCYDCGGMSLPEGDGFAPPRYNERGELA